MLQSMVARTFKFRIAGKSPLAAYVRLNYWLWRHLHPFFTTLLRSYGSFLHGLVRLSAIRTQNGSTYFLRNRAELELVRRLLIQKGKGASLKIAVLGCSLGAEVYSILWIIRSVRPDLKVTMHAVDISKEHLEFAQRGVYSLTTRELTHVLVFERMSKEEMQEMFEREGEKVKVKPWIKEGIIWHLADAGDPEVINVLGPQDIVVANRFLCHMDPSDAERCLRNIGQLVGPAGYLFVSGIDLDVRAKVAQELGWEPVRELMEEIHDGDPSLREYWPWGYWTMEPLNKRRKDWNVRYASAFRLWSHRLFIGSFLSKFIGYCTEEIDCIDVLDALFWF